MKQLGLFSQDTNINFLKYHKIYLLLSLILVVFFCLYPILKGLNLGVDFRGGTLIIVEPIDSKTDIATIKKEVLTLKGLDITFQEFKNNTRLHIIISKSSVKKYSNMSEPIDKIRKLLTDKVKIIKTEFVGPHISKQLIKGGALSVCLAFVGIFVYVWLRFNWQYSIIAILALMHDVIIGLGVSTLFNYEINISTIAAILTIIGYSINDTIITFSQVKENITRYPKMDNMELLNHSLNNVISRTISTSLTVVLVLLSVFLFGGDTLTSFSFTLLVGVIFGTYSSICIAVPALLYIGNFRLIKN